MKNVKRERLITAFALRFLAANLESEVEEMLSQSLNEQGQSSVFGDSEVVALAAKVAEEDSVYPKRVRLGYQLLRLRDWLTKSSRQ